MIASVLLSPAKEVSAALTMAAVKRLPLRSALSKPARPLVNAALNASRVVVIAASKIIVVSLLSLENFEKSNLRSSYRDFRLCLNGSQ